MVTAVQARFLFTPNRFCLSQCRRQDIDRALISWKVSVRAAQVIGGHVADRMACRKQVDDFCGIRSKAAQGGQLKQGEARDVSNATDVFLRLFLRLVQMKREPVWAQIELEPVSKD